MSIRQTLSVLTAAPALLAGGCISLAPKLELPEVAAPQEFKVPVNWKAAAPADGEGPGRWWAPFRQAQLDELIARAERDNPALAAALSRVEQARAMAAEARAELIPEIGVGMNVTQTRTSSNSPGFRPGQTFTFWRAPVTLRYEADVWGRIRGNAAAARAGLAGSEALAAAVRLLVQAELAANFFQLRALDAELAILDEGVEVRKRSLALVESRFAAGDVAELDVAQAKTELAEARAEALAVARRRALRENAIAALCGAPASVLKLQRRPLAGAPPAPRRALPSALLERRPDVAAAERAMEAANERIGVERAAFFPQVGIGIGGGLESAEFDRLFSTDSFLSTLAGGFEVPVIDGGRRAARVRRAWAERDETAAMYRETVVTAFQETEDALASLRLLAAQALAQADMVAGAQRMLELSEKQYEAGLVSFLEVVIAQRALLRAQQAAEQMRGLRYEAAVLLARALGGDGAF